MRRRGVAAGVAAVLAASMLGAVPMHAAAVPGPTTTVIVQFDAEPAISAAPPGGTLDAQVEARVAQAKQQVARAESAVLRTAAQAGIQLKPRRSYDVLLSGMSVEVPADQVDDLRRLPGVTAVHENAVFTTQTVDSVPLVGAPEVWQRTDPAEVPARGAGITVAVIDTGIDYTHPALGGGFGPDFKVVGGHDFVNDDKDPMDDHAHGTHVAGIIAGSGAGGAKAVTGVAPDASLTAYKVMDEFGRGTTEDIVAGIEAAVDPENPHRADVVNMSLGGYGDGTDPLGLASSRAAEAGVVVVASAGNSGPGDRTVGTPAAADGVLAVGASASGLRLPAVELASPVRQPVQTYRTPSSANAPAKPVTADVVDLGLGTKEDFDKAGDIRGKVLLVWGPPNPYEPDPYDIERFRIAEERGALAVLGHWGVRPHVEGQLDATPSQSLGASDDLRFDSLVVLGIPDQGHYEEIKELMADGPVTMTVFGQDVTDQIASFSSRGPDLRWGLKPQIVAPGVEIRSSVPVGMYDPGVFRFSGTSMAAPHVAGAAALLRQLKPDESAERLTAALIGSAKPLPDVGPVAGGAGRLDIPAAADALMTADPPALSLGLADLSRDRVEASGKVTLRNAGETATRVKLSVKPAVGSAGSAKVTPSTVTVPAAGSVTVSVNLTVDAPDQLRADVSGWLVADGPDSALDVRVPYALAVRTPDLHITPDPSGGQTEAFMYTVVPASAPPQLVIDPPVGPNVEVVATHDHGLWWRATLKGGAPGIYGVTAKVTTATGQVLVGRNTFEVGEKVDGAGWQLVGPNSTGGEALTTPADPHRMVVTPPTGAGLWITEDRARTWRHERIDAVAAGFPVGTVIDPKHADRMWVALAGGEDPTYQGKVVRTEDGGRTWQVLPFPDVPIGGLALSPSGDALHVVGDGTSIVSRDGGDSWTSTPAPWTGVLDLAFSGEDLYVVSQEGLWRWPGSSGKPVLVRPATDFDTSPAMLAVAGDLVVIGQKDNAVYGSRDGGRTWTHLLQTAPTGSFDLAELRAHGDTLLASGMWHTFLSEDAGKTWTEIEGPLANAPVDSVARWPGDDETLLLGLDRAGVYATDDDGASYVRLGVPGAAVDHLAVTGDRLLVGTPSEVYATTLPADPTRLEWGTSGGEDSIGNRVRGLAVAPDDPHTVWKVIETGFFGSRL
ncbi:S8 family serine peptidase, partial [Intrasporangium sp.]|uniref:S8 family serine peptidase n=1 Tax=Intrasporangium sp. TaxID=1925024 RepID=UPI00293B895D